MTTKSNTLKMLSIAFLLGAVSLSFSSCSKDDGDDNVTPELEVKTVTDLDGSADAGPAHFSFSSGTEVDETATTWDIKFDGSNFSFGNGAEAQVVEGIFDNLVAAPSSGYSSANITGIGSVYTYSGSPNHIVSPTPGRILVVKTHDNKYVKVELISYYRGNPDITTEAFINLATRPQSRVFTFRYVVQPDGTTNLK